MIVVIFSGVNMFAMLTGNLPFTVQPFTIKALYAKMIAGDMNTLPDYLSDSTSFPRICLSPLPLLLPPTKEEVNAIARDVCLSVCLLARLLTKTRAWISSSSSSSFYLFSKMQKIQLKISMTFCLSTDVRTWTNWSTFEPDPDHSPDAGTGLLSPVAYALRRRILLRRENPYWAPVAAATRGFESYALQRGILLRRENTT